MSKTETDHYIPTKKNTIEKIQAVCIVILSLAALIGPGLGYGKIYLFHLVIFPVSLFSGYVLFRKKSFKKLKATLLPLLLFSYIWLSVMWAPNRDMAINQAVQISLGAVLIANLFILTENGKHISLILKTAAVIWILSALIGIIEMYTDFAWPWSRNSFYLEQLGRETFLDPNKFKARDIALIRQTPTAFFWNPNNLALFFLCFLPLILFSKLNKWLVLAATLITLILIMGSGARLSFWLMLAVLPLLALWKLRLKNILSTAGVGLSMLFISLNPYTGIIPLQSVNQFKLPFSEYVFKPLPSIQEPKFQDNEIVEEENSISFRKEMINRAGLLVNENPIQGHGPGSVLYEFTQHKTHSGLVDLHFFWLELAVNFGLVWLFALLLGFATILYSLLKKNGRLSTALAVSFGLFFFCVISLSGAAYYLPGYLLFAALIICTQIRSENESFDWW